MATYKNKNQIIFPSPRVVLRFRFTVLGLRYAGYGLGQGAIPVAVPGFRLRVNAQRSAAQRVQHRTYQTRRYIDNIYEFKIINTMTYTLTCSNGKQIDFTEYILKQMKGEITRQDVLDRIEFYKQTNTK